MPFIRTTAINKIKSLTKFIKGVQGGTSAGKTFGILPIEIDYSIKNPLTETSIVAESYPHLRRGAMKDFKKIMLETGRWIDSHWKETNSTYTFSNGSFIEFFSADDDSKLRGARRDRLYMNEANNMSFHAYTELASRTKQSVTLDWNPVAPFWFHEELSNDDDVDFLTINYLDNEACPDSALNFILKAKDKASTSDFWRNWYNVYGLGKIGSLEGVIYNNWKQCDNIPQGSELVAYALDWGFTNDPTAMSAIYKFNGALYIEQLIYQTQMTNSMIVTEMVRLGVSRNIAIVADSAEPKSIQDLSNAGYYIEPAKKGPDSIRAGIDILQEYDIYVTSNSIETIKELRNYKWATDKTGKTLNVPCDGWNHALDGWRYVALNKLAFYAGGGNYFFS
jgi:phage terminase large subunit